MIKKTYLFLALALLILAGRQKLFALSKDQYLEVKGTKTDSATGLSGSEYYLIKGPTKFRFGHRYAETLLGDFSFPMFQTTMVYYDQALYNWTIGSQYVDKFILPIMNYNEVVNVYNATRKIFTDYVTFANLNDTDRALRRCQCPEDLAIGCPSKGDVVHHMVYTTATWRGLVAGILSLIPYEYDAGTLGSMHEVGKTKEVAYLTAAIGYHYGWYPDQKAFNDRFREDAIYLYTGADVPSDAAELMAGSLLIESLTNSAESMLKSLAPKLMAKLTVPGLDMVLGFAYDGISATKDVADLGYRARDYFRVNGPIKWYPVASGDNPFGTPGVRGIAFGDRKFIAVGGGGQMAYCDW